MIAGTLRLCASDQIPYCVFMIPGTMLILLIWGIFTLLSAFAKDLNTLYAYRFLVGFFGSISYTGSIFIIGFWYRKPEISRRLGLYAVSSPLLDTAAYEGLNGVNGLAEWRWLFIICSIITFPIAIYGFLAIPDTPATSRSLLLTKDEIEMSRQRIGAGVAPVKKILSFAVSEQRLSTSMSLYLKYYNKEFSIAQITNLPTVTNAISVVTTLVASWYTDKTRNPFVPAFSATAIAKFFAWFMGGSILVLQSLLMTWASILTIGDLEERIAIKTGTNIVVFPAAQAPRFKRGYIWTAVTGSLQLIFLVWIKAMTMWDAKKKKESIESLPVEGMTMDKKIPVEIGSSSD
ncbi:major facilitator superfamily domain-containing protein [Lipomyces doorenjongii]|uniref:major facilitator superfamily domain-containing protein n=1 Tax=Lipomyces doorenjongii TaxID=383834 RepID=UPI0034CD7014